MSLGPKKKVSKSDQDPHQTDADKAGIEKILSKKSQHFAVGTYVWCDGDKWMVDRYYGRVVWLTRDTDDGTEFMYVFNPYFMR